MFEIDISYDLENKSKNQIIYSAAFISQEIIKVNYNDHTIQFTLKKKLTKKFLKNELDKLVNRFSSLNEFTSDIVFTREFRGQGLETSEINNLIEKGIIQEVHQGLFIWREPMSKIMSFIDNAVIKKFSNKFMALEEKLPNVISIDSLAKTNHLSSFPEHLHFISHLEQNLDNIDGYSNSIKSDTSQFKTESKTSNPEIVHNPSTCYNCFAALKNKKITENMAITAKSSCHRYEASNHNELGRLLEFDLREVIFLGSPEYVRQTREKTLELVKLLSEEWELGGSLQSENDPFFTSDFEVKAKHQRNMKMKYEFRAYLTRSNQSLSIMSSNLHSLTFSKAFNITCDSWPVHTGCLGFGIERFAIALISQHGSNIEKWPDKLKKDWIDWIALNNEE